MNAEEIAIIGGGASGLASAIVAASCLRGSSEFARTNTRIVIYEAASKVGKSILRSGNGRCNFTNTRITNFSKDDFQGVYHNGTFVYEVLATLVARVILVIYLIHMARAVKFFIFFKCLVFNGELRTMGVRIH